MLSQWEREARYYEKNRDRYDNGEKELRRLKRRVWIWRAIAVAGWLAAWIAVRR